MKMDDAEVIARQAKRIMELEAERTAHLEAFADIRKIIYCIGGPLNDNVLGYSSKQMVPFQRIADLADWPWAQNRPLQPLSLPFYGPLSHYLVKPIGR